ncbi:hypothetical protein BsWGS_04177 [Bradybaena similaris]
MLGVFRIHQVIHGTSLKKGCKDGCTGRSSSKVLQRQDSRTVSKPKSFSKKSSKEKQKSENLTVGNKQKSENLTVGNKQKSGSEKSGTKDVEKMANLEDPSVVKQNGHTDGSSDAKGRLNAKEDKISPSTTAVSSSPAISTASSQPLRTEEKVRRDSELQDVSDKSAQPTAHRVASPEQARKQESQRMNQQQSVQQPLHGILKDSGNNGSTSVASTTRQQGYSSQSPDPADAQPRDQPYIRSSHRPPRTPSLRGNAAPFFEESYGSLPRNSRSTTPTTADNAYNYGSFPRRSNNTVPKQQNVFYNDTQDLGSLARKSESHLEFSVSNKDRDPSLGRSNYATINYNKSNYGTVGYSSDIYGVDNKYGIQRAPSGSDSQNSLYSTIRNGGSSTQYFSDGESGRQHRGVRAGSLPLGYESDSGAYVMVGPGQSRFGSIPRNYESRPEYGVGSFSGLRATSGEEQYRAGPEKRPIPRRHTLGGPGKRTDSTDSVSSVGLCSTSGSDA